MNSNSPETKPDSTNIQTKKEPEYHLITIREVAELTGIPYKTLWRNRKKIPGYVEVFPEYKKTFFVKSVLVEYLKTKPKKS